MLKRNLCLNQIHPRRKTCPCVSRKGISLCCCTVWLDWRSCSFCPERWRCAVRSVTVVLVLHASNFPNNWTTQMFISYQVSHHCLPPPYQIWGGTTVAEVLEMMKAKHIQGKLNTCQECWQWVIPPFCPALVRWLLHYWVQFWASHARKLLAYPSQYMEHMMYERDCESWICSPWRRKGWVEDGRAFSFLQLPRGL